MSLTDNYWNLHRNSLIASSLLFMASAKAISIDKMQFWQIQDAGHFVQICLFIAALYTYFVYLANGRRQLRDNFVSIVNQLSGDRENYASMLGNIQSQMNEIGSSNSQCLAQINLTLAELKNSPTEGSLSIYPETISGLFGQEIYEISQAISDPDHLPPQKSPSLTEVDYERHLERWRVGLSERTRRVVERLVSKAYAYSAGQARNAIFPNIELMQVSFNNYIRDYNAISENIKRISEQQNQINRQIKLNIALAKAESFISGWQIPTAMIFISVAHFVGIYLPIFNNAIYYLDFLGLLRS